ncbi:TIR domain-containing protein [Catelliglobosispora koreensis]|uniref:TIR domain-containing protein n=1 Tax=Catelliglobosispora koreensis TaxID=129052 RepID=UPI0003A0745C
MPQVASDGDGHVFISYRHGTDGEYVVRLAEYLAAKGVHVWFDRENHLRRPMAPGHS